MLRLFLTEILVTMTLHSAYSWQQTQNYITTKLGENVAIKTLYWVDKNGKNPRLLTNFLMKSAFLTNEKWHFWRTKSFGASTWLSGVVGTVDLWHSVDIVRLTWFTGYCWHSACTLCELQPKCSLKVIINYVLILLILIFQVVKNDLNPKWRPFDLKASRLCGGNYSASIQVSVTAVN